MVERGANRRIFRQNGISSDSPVLTSVLCARFPQQSHLQCEFSWVAGSTPVLSLVLAGAEPSLDVNLTPLRLQKFAVVRELPERVCEIVQMLGVSHKAVRRYLRPYGTRDEAQARAPGKTARSGIVSFARPPKGPSCYL